MFRNRYDVTSIRGPAELLNGIAVLIGNRFYYQAAAEGARSIETAAKEALTPAFNSARQKVEQKTAEAINTVKNKATELKEVIVGEDDKFQPIELIEENGELKPKVEAPIPESRKKCCCVIS
jgi:hypothetical protein